MSLNLWDKRGILFKGNLQAGQRLKFNAEYPIGLSYWKEEGIPMLIGERTITPSGQASEGAIPGIPAGTSIYVMGSPPKEFEKKGEVGKVYNQLSLDLSSGVREELISLYSDDNGPLVDALGER